MDVNIATSPYHDTLGFFVFVLSCQQIHCIVVTMNTLGSFYLRREELFRVCSSLNHQQHTKMFGDCMQSAF